VRRGGGAALLRTAAAAAALAAACAATRLTSVWQEADWSGAPLGSLVVVGLSPDPGARRVYEEALAGALVAAGVRAIESSDVLPDLERIESSTIGRWVAEQGIDGVLVTHLSRVEKEARYVPPPYDTDFYGYTRWAWPVLAQPGYVVEDTIVHLETNLYDASGRLVWSAASETFNPGSRDQLTRELVPILVQELRARGLLAGAPGA
jgi:hypothetical protein